MDASSFRSRTSVDGGGAAVIGPVTPVSFPVKQPCCRKNNRCRMRARQLCWVSLATTGYAYLNYEGYDRRLLIIAGRESVTASTRLGVNDGGKLFVIDRFPSVPQSETWTESTGDQ